MEGGREEVAAQSHGAVVMDPLALAGKVAYLTGFGILFLRWRMKPETRRLLVMFAYAVVFAAVRAIWCGPVVVSEP